MAEHQRQLLDAHLRQQRLVAEDAAGHVTVGEHLRLQLQEAAGAVAQMDHRQPVLHRDVERAHALLDRQRIPGPALDRGIVGADDRLAPRHDSDADDGAGARRFAAIGHVGGERGEFEKRRAGIEQSCDALARQHLALARQAVEVALRPPMPRRLLLLAQFARQPAVMGVVGAELGAGGRDHGGDAAHPVKPPPGGSSSATISSLSKVSPTPRARRAEHAVARGVERHLQLHALDRHQRLAARHRLARLPVDTDHRSRHRRAHMVAPAPAWRRSRRAGRSAPLRRCGPRTSGSDAPRHGRARNAAPCRRSRPSRRPSCPLSADVTTHSWPVDAQP